MARRLPVIAALMVAVSAQADPAFEVPVVPCHLLEGGCGATPGRVHNGDWAQTSLGPTIRTVMDGELQTPKRQSAGLLRTSMELDPRIVSVVPGTTVLIEIAIGHLNRIVTPFPSPVVHTVSSAQTQVEGPVVYVATDSDEPVALYISDAPGSTTALSLTLAPRYVPPREIRLNVPGYSRKTASVKAPTGSPATAPVALANADLRTAESEGSTSYVSGIVELLRAMAQGRLPPGYQARKGSGDARVRCGEPLKVRRTQVTEGPASSVVTAAVRNMGEHPYAVDQFACDIDNRIIAAIAAWPRKILAPGEETEVFLVVAQGERMRDPTGAPR